jgi:hypothetical protein
MIAEKFGSPPEITYYETPIIVDNSRANAMGLQDQKAVS